MTPETPSRFATLLATLTRDQWRAIDAELRADGPTERSPRGDTTRTVAVLVTAAVSLSLLEYYGSRGFFRSTLAPLGLQFGNYNQLAELAFWCFSCGICYIGVPALVIKGVLREDLSDYGFRIRGFFSHLWIYLLLFLGVAPMVYLASLTEAFQRKYPFYKLAGRSLTDLLLWEGLYAGQFFALEFFFRGFLLFGLARQIGAAAIPVMALPYCMIHFGKPFPETIGAIGAGMILGTVALRTRSIYAGVLIHVAVAWSMDLLSLGFTGRLHGILGR